MPFWVALFVPAVLLLSLAVALEFLLFGSQDTRQAWLMLLNIMLAVLAALAVTGFMTELFKRICGRLRCGCCDGAATCMCGGTMG